VIDQSSRESQIGDVSKRQRLNATRHRIGSIPKWCRPHRRVDRAACEHEGRKVEPQNVTIPLCRFGHRVQIPPRFLAGGVEMGAIMRSLDWTGSSLSAPETWPQPLRTAVRLMLTTGHPMYICWGDERGRFTTTPIERAAQADRQRRLFEQVPRFIAILVAEPVISGFVEVEGIAPDLPRLTKPFRQADLAAALVGLRAE
jgi:hypothetical protein